jgi:CDP-diacylglycerol--serine O-phosphatidyltransferase
MKYKLPQHKRHKKSRPRKIRKRFKKPIPRVVVPSFFTLMNLFCGFVAIIQIHEGKLEFGAWLIIFAGLFDALDGFMARLANATSSFGIELDSLSDVVSFGVAPGFLLYSFSFSQLSTPGIIISTLPAICGAVRLARFNVETKEVVIDYFRGLPIPAQASMIVAFFLTFNGELYFFNDLKYGVNSILIPMVVLLSLLMVSTVPFDKIPRFSRGYVKKHRGRVLLFVGYFLAIIFFQEYGLMAVFTIFIGKGIGMAGYQLWNDLQNNGEDDNDEDILIVDDRYDNDAFRVDRF